MALAFFEEHVQASCSVEYPSTAAVHVTSWLDSGCAFWAGILSGASQSVACIGTLSGDWLPILRWSVPCLFMSTVIPAPVVVELWFFKSYLSIYISYLEFCKEELWMWVWANSKRWWRTEKPDGLQSSRLQRVGQDLVTKQQQQRKGSSSFLSTWSHGASEFNKLYQALLLFCMTY